jgi:prolyl 4-hydroxylase
MEKAGVALLLAAGVVWLVALFLLLDSRRASPNASPLSLTVDGCEMRLEVLHRDPTIRVVHGFVSHDEAAEVIEKYAHLLRRSTVASRDNETKNSEHESRTSHSAFLPAGSEQDPLVSKIEERAVAIAGKNLKDMETLQLVRYQGGSQYYRHHFDYFHNNPESQRTTTIFVYLNDTNGEGPTNFSKLRLDVFPETGKACVWENCYASGRGTKCDDRLEHAGMSLKSSDAVKYGLNIWFRTLPFR